MVLRSARNLNDPGSSPHPGVFKINFVFLSLLQKVSGAILVFSH